jgi:starch synthase (maltosyl-transferring)
MATTLSNNHGVFGPSYAYLYHADNPPKEEYKDSEKYEIKYWNKRNKMAQIYTEINKIRKQNAALQDTNNIEFCKTRNDNRLAYVKTRKNGNRLLFIVNPEAYNIQSGIVKLPLNLINKHPYELFTVHDLISGAKYIWRCETNFVSLEPNILPFH